MMINRRTFSAALVAGAAASLTSVRGETAVATPTKARNVVLCTVSSPTDHVGRM
jgi:hypothetical protein